MNPVSKFPTKPRNCRTPLAPLRKGSWRRSRLRGRLFGGARTLLPIRLWRCPDRSLTAKPAQRATDGRPYELKSVPTKTVAIRTTGNCAILVQKFCAAPPLAPLRKGSCRRSRLRGRKRRQPHRLVRKRPSHLPLHRGGKRARRLSSAPCLQAIALARRMRRKFKSVRHSTVVRGKNGFLRTLDTGLPQ